MRRELKLIFDGSQQLGKRFSSFSLVFFFWKKFKEATQKGPLKVHQSKILKLYLMSS